MQCSSLYPTNLCQCSLRPASWAPPSRTCCSSCPTGWSDGCRMRATNSTSSKVARRVGKACGRGKSRTLGRCCIWCLERGASTRWCRRSVMRLNRQFHSWRSFHPGVAMACQIIAAIKQCDHILLVERLATVVAEVGRNARKVEGNSVTPGDRIDSIEIADPLVLDQRGY